MMVLVMGCERCGHKMPVYQVGSFGRESGGRGSDAARCAGTNGWAVWYLFSHMGLRALWLMLIPGLALAAAPSIQSVADSAGFGPRGAPGSLASLFGTALAVGTASAAGFPLPALLQGASVTVSGIPAPLLYVSPSQINFQIPSSVKAGQANVVVTGPGGTSASYSFTVTAAAPSIFQYSSGPSGLAHALAQNAGGTLNSGAAPAAAGSVITVYLTGQGAVSNPVTDGTAAPLSPLSTASAAAIATIGPANAPVQFLGLTPEFAGLAQANIQVPALPSGDYPLVITMGGMVSASAVISVSGSGTAYTSPLTLAGSAAFAGSSSASVALYGNVAYVCGPKRVVMVDVTTLTSPNVIGAFGDSVLNGAGGFCAVNAAAGTPFLVVVVGSVTAGTQSLAVYSLSNPSAPALLTVAATSYGHLENLSFSGSYGFATSSYYTYVNSSRQITSQTGELLVFSFANPASPQFVTILPSAGNQEPYVSVVQQLYAYIASTTATGGGTSGNAVLDVASIASPGAPAIISQISIPQAAILLSLDVSGTTLLAAGNTTAQRNPGNPDFDFTGYLTLTAMDLSDPAVPAITSTVTTQLQVNGTYNTAAFTNGFFAIVNNPPVTDNSGPSSLLIADARNPSALQLYPFQTQFGFSGILTTTNGYLFAPTLNGLNIYQLQQ